MTARARSTQRLSIQLPKAQTRRVQQRDCSRCGVRHHHPDFVMCATCRDLDRVRCHERYWDHVAKKLCVRCSDARAGGARQCRHHLEYHNALEQRNQADQLSKGLCTVGRCPNELSNARYCEKHNEMQKAWTRARNARLAQGLPPARGADPMAPIGAHKGGPRSLSAGASRRSAPAPRRAFGQGAAARR